MLTSQLEKQRRFFEDALDQQAKDTVRQINELKEKTRIAIDERKELECKMTQVNISLRNSRQLDSHIRSMPNVLIGDPAAGSTS